MRITNLNALRVAFSKFLPEGFAGWVEYDVCHRAVKFIVVTVFDGEELTSERLESLEGAMWSRSPMERVYMPPSSQVIQFAPGILEYIARDRVRQITALIESRPRTTRVR